jgi:hypothetical protein
MSQVTTAEEPPAPGPRPRCGCCGRCGVKLAELGSTPGVFICIRCSFWAVRRALGLPALPGARLVRGARRIVAQRRSR